MRVILGAISFFCALAAAAGHVSASNVTIDAVLAGYDHGGIFLELTTDIPNPANCSNTAIKPKVVAVIPARSDVGHVLSIALTAKTLDSSLDIDIYDDICFSDWAVVRKLKLK